MKKANLEDLTDQELENEEKKRKQFFYVLIGVVLFTAASTIYSLAKTTISISTFYPLFFAPIMIVLWSNIKKVEKEVQFRKQKVK